MVMRSLVGAFCGPRTPTLRLTDAGSASRAARNPFRSVEESSRTSPFESVNDLRFFITSNLSSVGFTEADDTNAVVSLDKAQNMESVAEHSQGDVAHLAVIASIIDGIQGILEIKVCGGQERKSADADIPFVFSWIERDTRGLNCTYN
jgi:hypothetical protein